MFWNLLKNAVKFTPAGSGGLWCGRSTSPPERPARTWARPATPASTAPPSAKPSRIGRDRRGHRRRAAEPAAHLQRVRPGAPARLPNVTAAWAWAWRFPRRWSRRTAGHLTVASEGEGQGRGVHGGFAHLLPRPPFPTNPSATRRTCPALAGTHTYGSASTAKAPVPAMHGEGRSVLLVDDHLDTCLGMSRLLRRRGYKVAVAHSVAEAKAPRPRAKTSTCSSATSACRTARVST